MRPQRALCVALFVLSVLARCWVSGVVVGHEPKARDPSDLVGEKAICQVACGDLTLESNVGLKLYDPSRVTWDFDTTQKYEMNIYHNSFSGSQALIVGVKKLGWYQLVYEFSGNCGYENDENVFFTVQNECTKGAFGFPLRANYNITSGSKYTFPNSLAGARVLMIQDHDNQACTDASQCSSKGAMWVGETKVTSWTCSDKLADGWVFAGKCCRPSVPIVIGTFLLTPDNCELDNDWQNGCGPLQAATNRLYAIPGCPDAIDNKEAWKAAGTSVPHERAFFSDIRTPIFDFGGEPVGRYTSDGWGFCTTSEHIRILHNKVQATKPSTCPAECAFLFCGEREEGVLDEDSGECRCQCAYSEERCKEENGEEAKFTAAGCACQCPATNTAWCQATKGMDWKKSATLCECECTLNQQTCETRAGSYAELSMDTCQCGCPLTTAICVQENGNNNFWRKRVDKCDCECFVTNAACMQAKGRYSTARFDTCECGCDISDVFCAVQNGGNPNYRPMADGTCNCGCTMNQTKCHQQEGPEGVFNAQACTCTCPLASSANWCQTNKGQDWKAAANGDCACECTLTDDKCRQRFGPYSTADPATCSCKCSVTDAFCAAEHSSNVNWVAKGGDRCDCECGLEEETCEAALGPEAYLDGGEVCQCKCPVADSQWCRQNKGPFWQKTADQCRCQCIADDTICKAVEGENAYADTTNGACQCKCDVNDERCKQTVGPNWRKKEDQCECGCPILIDDDCGDFYPGGSADWEALPTAQCGCRCGIDASVCQFRHGPEATFDPSTCTCGCSAADDAACKLEYGQDFGKVSADRCECECKLTDGTCRTRVSSQDMVANTDTCSCQCALQDRQCVARLGANHVANHETCLCQCGLNGTLCAQANEGVAAHWEVTNSCTCNCLLTDAMCKLQDGAEARKKPGFCSCECPITDEWCKANVGKYFGKASDGSCECECKLTDQQCKAEDGEFAVFSAEECDCNCDLTDQKCAQTNGNNNKWKKKKNKCSCECTMDPNTRCQGDREVSLETCACECKWQSDEDCQDWHNNFLYALDQEAECQCKCAGSDEKCRMVGQEDDSEEDGEQRDSGLIFDALRCSCTRKTDNDINTGAIIGGIFGAALGLGLLGGILYMMYRIGKKRRRPKIVTDAVPPNSYEMEPTRRFVQL
ncbi:hypothetical protein QOT17_019842 [Balamuthia mandrillaris]